MANYNADFERRIGVLESRLANGDEGGREAFEGVLMFVDVLNDRVTSLESEVTELASAAREALASSDE